MKIHPMSNMTAAISILGLVVSAVGTYNGFFGLSWGIAFTSLFAIFFIASLITMKPTMYERH